MQQHEKFTPLRRNKIMLTSLPLQNFNAFFTYSVNGKTTCNTRSVPSYAKLWNFDWLVNAPCSEYVSESGEVIEVRVSCLKCVATLDPKLASMLYTRHNLN